MTLSECCRWGFTCNAIGAISPGFQKITKNSFCTPGEWIKICRFSVFNKIKAIQYLTVENDLTNWKIYFKFQCQNEFLEKNLIQNVNKISLYSLKFIKFQFFSKIPYKKIFNISKLTINIYLEIINLDFFQISDQIQLFNSVRKDVDQNFF